MDAGTGAMSHHELIAFVAPTLAQSMRRWFVHLGGLGFIPLGLLDSSVIPLPGSMDVLTIVLAARDSSLWFYYAVMATIGSVIGGYVTYRIARKGGKEAVAKRFPVRVANRAYKVFERWGFASIAIPAVLPPPTPMVAFVLAAGAMQYSTTKFLTALALGRFVRYTLLAYLGVRYGRHIVRVMREHEPVVIWVSVVMTAIVVAVYLALRASRTKQATAL